MNPDLAMGEELLKKTGAGNLFMDFGEPDVEIRKIRPQITPIDADKKKPNSNLRKSAQSAQSADISSTEQIVVEIKGLDVYDPTTGAIRNSSTDDIACWFIDTDYNGESFFVRHAYFTGAEEPYDKLKRALRAQIDEAAWSALYSTESRPFPKPTSSGKIAVEVINHYGDEILKVFNVLESDKHRGRFVILCCQRETSMIRRLSFLAIPFCLAVSLSAQVAAPGQKYQPLIDALERWLPQEIEAKGIPALSVAIVDDQTLVWSKGFGHEDPHAKTPATADTVYRVGSVSKPITALLLMMLVEAGLIDLDVPVEKYLPDFRPKNESGKAITLRQILCHKSGLVRESPVGNYFDASEPKLTATVASLNKTELVYKPEEKTSYSNAALATVGLVLEKTQKEPFETLMRKRLLEPIGMKSSSYAMTPELQKHLAKAIMWTYHGRTFPAPTWELGMPSAGNLYSSANDQARLLSFLLAWGKTQDGKQLLKKETLESMYKVQFAKPKETAGFGLSWFVSEFEGRHRIGHGGAVYGFATDFSALPDDKLGVVTIASKDVANGTTQRVSDYVLRGMLALRAGKPLPPVEQTKPLDLDKARALAGRYQSKTNAFDLEENGGRLYLWPVKGGIRQELRLLGDDLFLDDAMAFGVKIGMAKDALIINKDTYERVPTPKPQPLPEKWRGLIGEYGQDHNVLFILEKDGKLQALIEWVFVYPLEEVAKDVYKFPNFGLYHGDKVIFHRDKAGRCTMVEAASVPFERRTLLGETGTYKIRPLRPVAELRKEAMAAMPPVEKNAALKKPDLVEVTSLEPTIKIDIRYAGADNFLGTPVYSTAKAFLQRPAAEALVRAHKKLGEQGFGLAIHDAYRPWHVTKVFWDATPETAKLFVADPTQGSRHNRGCAVDLTLYERKTGKMVDMVSGYDEFSDRSYPHYLGGTSAQRWHRDLLRRAMETEGFTVFHAEWWHFDYHAWRAYPILNEPFERLAGK